MCAREICEYFVFQEQYNMLKISLLFKKSYKIHGQKTSEFLGLTMEDFQGTVFI